jgi:hypothetical protein
MKTFTLLEISNMITKGSNRTLTVSEAAKMLKDISTMNENDANTYLKLWSNMQWFKRVYNTNNPMYVIVSCNENKNAYIEFLLSDVENTK